MSLALVSCLEYKENKNKETEAYQLIEEKQEKSWWDNFTGAVSGLGKMINIGFENRVNRHNDITNSFWAGDFLGVYNKLKNQTIDNLTFVGSVIKENWKEIAVSAIAGFTAGAIIAASGGMGTPLAITIGGAILAAGGIQLGRKYSDPLNELNGATSKEEERELYEKIKRELTGDAIIIGTGMVSAGAGATFWKTVMVRPEISYQFNTPKGLVVEYPRHPQITSIKNGFSYTMTYDYVPPFANIGSLEYITNLNKNIVQNNLIITKSNSVSNAAFNSNKLLFETKLKSHFESYLGDKVHTIKFIDGDSKTVMSISQKGVLEINIEHMDKIIKNPEYYLKHEAMETIIHPLPDGIELKINNLKMSPTAKKYLWNSLNHDAADILAVRNDPLIAKQWLIAHEGRYSRIILDKSLLSKTIPLTGVEGEKMMITIAKNYLILKETNPSLASQIIEAIPPSHMHIFMEILTVFEGVV